MLHRFTAAIAKFPKFPSQMKALTLHCSSTGAPSGLWTWRPHTRQTRPPPPPLQTSQASAAQRHHRHRHRHRLLHQHRHRHRYGHGAVVRPLHLVAQLCFLPARSVVAPAQRAERPRDPGGVAVFTSTHSKTPYITHGMDICSGEGVVRGRRMQQLAFTHRRWSWSRVEWAAVSVPVAA